MWNVKLCMGLSEQFGIDLQEQMRLLKKIGFDAIFFEWSPERDVTALRRTADKLGLELQSVHAPYLNMHFMWEEGTETENAVLELLSCLKDCADNHVPIMVCHAYIGFNKPMPNPLGVKNFSRVVDAAEKSGVKIAFENTEGEEYLAYLMEHFSDRACVGFCWDTGHELCYNHGRDMMELYGDRIFCTHLNDNLGIRDYNGEITYIDDLHLLPFDGIADWCGIAHRLNKYEFDDILTFELNTVSKSGRRENDIYAKMKPEDYFTEVYKRACRVAALKERDKRLRKIQ